ncbi:hypothetical protein AX14_011682 [Amanita brunnescens Koide BX004]|nr:hypothetical protein AX14_011682 [Amanita brunnescens Koide BX004]
MKRTKYFGAAIARCRRLPHKKEGKPRNAKTQDQPSRALRSNLSSILFTLLTARTNLHHTLPFNAERWALSQAALILADFEYVRARRDKDILKGRSNMLVIHFQARRRINPTPTGTALKSNGVPDYAVTVVDEEDNWIR